MAGTVTYTEDGDRDGLVRCTLAWTSTAGGVATSTISRISGTLERFTFVPGGGSTVPSAGYDVTLTDDDGFDVLTAKGANLSETTASQHLTIDSSAVLPIAICGPLDLAVANAGAAKTGVIRLYVRT